LNDEAAPGVVLLLPEQAVKIPTPMLRTINMARNGCE